MLTYYKNMFGIYYRFERSIPFPPNLVGFIGLLFYHSAISECRPCSNVHDETHTWCTCRESGIRVVIGYFFLLVSRLLLFAVGFIFIIFFLFCHQEKGG